MHDNNYVHLDIKPENITIYGNDDINQCESKLIDFGVAKNIDGLSYMNSIYSVGTEHYMAPELNSETKPSDYTKCDIYSLGDAIVHGTNLNEETIIKQLTPLNNMVDDDPSNRPNIQFIISELSKIIDNLKSANNTSTTMSVKDRISFFENYGNVE